MCCSLAMFLTLFLTMDAIGNIGSCLYVLEHVDKKRYWWVVFREMLIALAFMLGFNAIGPFLLDALNVSQPTVLIASGMILFLYAISVLYPSDKNIRNGLTPGVEPFIVPLAVPLISGPALLATISLYAVQEPLLRCRLEAIISAWALSALILLCGRYFQRFLGSNGLMALERLLALILVMLATQHVMQGIKLFLNTHA